MNCMNHPDTPAAAYCRTCGQPLCAACQRPAQGSIFCEQHLPAQVAASARSASPPPAPVGGSSPGLAFLLGLIPGVGAIYNGQYAKGLVHVVILGLLISITSSGGARGFEPLFGFLIAIFYVYMPFEAYHTARRRQLGQAVDEFSSLLPMRSASRGFPVGPVLLIALGVLFLLNNLELLRFERIVRYWPVLLIGLGGYMLYCRLTGLGPRGNGGEAGNGNR
jgi:TM2 domain-containing membrane protein YozV